MKQEDTFFNIIEEQDQEVIAWHRVSTDIKTADFGIQAIEGRIKSSFPSNKVTRFYCQESGYQGDRDNYQQFVTKVANTHQPIVIIFDWYALGHRAVTKSLLRELVIDKQKGRLISLQQGRDSKNNDDKLKFNILAQVDERMYEMRREFCGRGQQSAKERDRIAKLEGRWDDITFKGRIPGYPNKRMPSNEAIIAVMDKCNGNKTKAAKELGISRRTILRRLA